MNNTGASPTIAILLASYNGAQFIAEQLDSIINQSYQNWELAIRDDGSTDETASIIQRYCNQDKRIRQITDNKGNLKSSQNFSALMKHHLHAEYIMFADQDDVWAPNKIEISYLEMKEKEDQFGKDTPILIYTNFQYVDDHLNEIKQSSRSSDPLANQGEYLPRLLAQNWIYGCTTIFNRALCNKAYPVPVEAENHDYWISLVAASYGLVFHLPVTTIKYRQHSSNVSGTFNDSSLQNRLKRVLQLNKSSVNLINRRISLFKNLTGRNDLQKQKHELVKLYIQKCQQGGIPCIWFCYKNGIMKRGFFQTAIYYLQLY